MIIEKLIIFVSYLISKLIIKNNDKYYLQFVFKLFIKNILINNLY